MIDYNNRAKFKKIDKKNIVLNYILIYFLFAFGGVTAFSSNSRFVQAFAVFIVLLFIYKRKVVDKEIIYIISFITALYIGQYLTFNLFSFKNYVVLLYTFIIPYSIIKIVGRNFTDYYIKIAFYFAIISFIFIIPSYLSPEFRTFIKNLAIYLNIDPIEGVHENFIIYNYEELNAGIIKNPGPFYESGAFGAFLIIALILNLIQTKRITEKKNLVFILALLSTFSTASYLALFSLIFFYFTSDKKIWKNLLIIPLFLFLAYKSFTEFSFLQEKIETQFEQSKELGENSLRVGRIHSGRLDLIDIKKHPVFGRGLISKTRYENIYEMGSNNGITDLAARYGIIGFFLFFLLIMKSLKLYCRTYNFNVKFAFFALIPIAIVLFAQVIYPKPAFLALMMMFILYNNNRKQVFLKKKYAKLLPEGYNNQGNLS